MSNKHDDDDIFVGKKGLKLNNKASSVAPPKENNAVVFEGLAKDAFTKYEDYKQRVFDLSNRFKSMMEDRILTENKTVISKDLEKETLDKLITLFSEMNTDDTQPEGFGGIAGLMLTYKMLLNQRDTINKLLFKVEKLEKNNFKLETELKAISSSKKEAEK